MIPIVVFWTKYTAIVQGRVVKLVPCESCSTEYVYVLERQSSGVGTSVYALSDDSAVEHAKSAAEDTLQSYLANDFDAVPCPVCGHYQKYMFPKLLETRSLWGPLAFLVVFFIGCLAAAATVFCSVAYLREPSDYVFSRLISAIAVLLIDCPIVIALLAIKRARLRRFDPNLVEGQEVRLQKGRGRAVTKIQFDELLEENSKDVRKQ